MIELLVVIAIIGILSSLVIARFSDWGGNARIANTLQWSAGVNRKMGANLVGHWPLNRDTKDISGYGNNGTMYNFTGEPDDYWVDGVPGTGNQALKFDGSNDYVNCGNDASFNIEDEITLSAWVKLSRSGAEWEDIITKGVTFGGQAMYYIALTNTNLIYFEIRDKDDTRRGTYKDLVSSYRNAWTHLVMTYDGNNIIGYVNGVEISRNYYATTKKIKVNASDVTIGGLRFVEGEIGDVRIYDADLTVKEVGRIYAETKDQYLAYE